jgi:predicted glycogen debranching enzyme
LTAGRELCGNWHSASRYEWLVTNGLGGFACGTICGANTRRYHGFLMASLRAPVERTLLVAKIDLSVEHSGRRYELSANEFEGGTISPQGYVHLESFAVRDGIPTWRYAIADALLEQRIFMAPGANTTYLRVELLRGPAALRLEFKPLVTYRDYHSHGRGAQAFSLVTEDDSCTIRAFEAARPYRLSISSGQFIAAGSWNWNFFHRAEAERGLDALEDLYSPGSFHAQLAPNQSVCLIATAETPAPSPGPEVLDSLLLRSRQLLAVLPKTAPPWIRQLALASDQFIVRRGEDGPQGTSIIAGYPWFADWGRDTMIALPGLATGLARYEVAAETLRTYAKFVDRGMLPNRFADSGGAPEYNTADATLWFFHALDDYLAARRDPALVLDLFPTLLAILHAHVEGTRFCIQVDPADGLLRAGEPGVQLTWMDAKQGDRVFTPRIGKPVEINALWLNALSITMGLAERRRDSLARRFCQTLLARASASFTRFWNEERACLYDVIDVNGEAVRDASLRPNQLFAISLGYSALSQDQMRAVVDACARELLTSYGLRSLSPEDPAYIGSYAGDQGQRDAAYHQGTVWSWLLGPFAWAHYRAYGNARLAKSFLAPIAEHLQAGCIGSVSEIFDGNPPHAARGCFAQAWSVAEILRVWIRLERESSLPGSSARVPVPENR